MFSKDSGQTIALICGSESKMLRNVALKYPAWNQIPFP